MYVLDGDALNYFPGASSLHEDAIALCFFMTVIRHLDVTKRPEAQVSQEYGRQSTITHKPSWISTTVA